MRARTLLEAQEPETKETVFAGPLVRIEAVACHRAQHGPSCEECKTEHQIGVPLSGVNLRHVAGKTFTVSPSHVTLSNRGEEYRVSHPFGSGERMLGIVLREDVLLDLVGARDPGARERTGRPFLERQVPADAKLHFAVQLLVAAARSPASTALEVEETAVFLVDRIVGASARPAGTLAPRDLEIAHRARAALAARYEQPLALEDVAAALGLSVYHLCRVFRRAAGITLWGEVQQLRVRAALARLAAGARDLTALALELGYAHHSHFAAAFRRELGLAPSAARRLLDTGSLGQVRELLRH